MSASSLVSEDDDVLEGAPCVHAHAHNEDDEDEDTMVTAGEEVSGTVVQ